MAKGIPLPDKISQEDTDLISLLKSRLKVAKEWCKGPHESWKTWIDEYNIEDFKDTEEVRDKVRIGYIFRKIEAEQPSIFDDQPDLFITGRHPNTKEIEPLIEGAYDFLWDSENLEEKIEDLGVYSGLLGMAFMNSPWVTKTKTVKEMVEQPVQDEMGQPMIDPMTGQPMTQPVEQAYEVTILDQPMAGVCDPFKVFFSPETKFGPIMDHEHCPYYFIEHVMTVDEVESRFGKKVDSTETLKTNDTLTDAALESDSAVVKDDLKRVTCYEYYGSLPKENAKGIKGSSDWKYDKEYHIWLTNNEELKGEECPYDSKPLFILGNYGLANKFWKFGEAKHLVPLVQEYQMYRSQILQHTRKMANPKPLLPDTAQVDEAAFTDPRVGRVVKFSGQVAPSYLQPAALGSEVGIGVDIVKADLEKQSPQFDLAGGTGESTVKSPRGIQVYSEAADKQVRRKRKRIARLIKHLISFQFTQLGQNWKPDDAHTLSVMGESDTQNVQVTTEVLEVISGVNQMYHLDIEIESLSINRVQMKRDALDLWDTVKDRPDIFNLLEIAKDLLQNGYGKKDADRYLIPMTQIVAQYIAQNPDQAAQMVLQAREQQQQQLATQQTDQALNPQQQGPPQTNERNPQP